MRLFSEKVVPTFTSSNLNILTVEDFQEVFFDVFEFEINGKKFIAEKVSDYKGLPVVDVPLVLEGKEFTAQFVLQRGKFEVLFNRDNSTFVGEVVEEKVEPVIEYIDRETEVEEMIFEKKDDILKEINLARQSAEKYVEKLKQQKIDETAQYFDERKKVLDAEIDKSKKGLLGEFLSLVENIKSEFFETNEKERDKLTTFIERSVNRLADQLSKSITQKQEAAEEKFSEQINELATNILSGVLLKEISNSAEKNAKNINERFETISNNLRKITASEVTQLDEKISRKLDEYNNSIIGLEKTSIELNDQINKGTNKALSRIGNVKTQLEESLVSTKKELTDLINEADSKLTEDILGKINIAETNVTDFCNTKIEAAENKIKTFYDQKIALVEEKVVDLTAENKQYFVNLISESKLSLLNEISNIKVDVPNIVVERSNGKQEVDLKGIKSELEKIIGTRFSNELQSLKRLIEMSSGGGSVAKQFANGGTMDGNLIVTGSLSASNYLGLNIPTPDLSQYLPISGGTITNDLTVTGSLSASNYLGLNIPVPDLSQYFPISGGTITGDTRFNSNVTIFGNLTTTGTTTFANTVFSVTSALSVVHIGDGPAMWVGNDGTGDIASFYDIDTGIEVLHVGGDNGTFPNVGIKTSAPNKTLTVNGEISATSSIYSTSFIKQGGTGSQFLKADGTIDSSSYYVMEAIPISASFIAEIGKHYSVDTTSSVIATLPITPIAGNIIHFSDAKNNWGINPLTIDPNGSNINSLSSSFIASTSGDSIAFIYIDNTIGWSSYRAVGQTGPPGPEPSINIIDNSSTLIILDDTYNNRIMNCTASTAITVIVPSGLSSSFSCMVIQSGTGRITFQGGDGVTLNSFGNLLLTAGQHSPVSIIGIGTNTYNIFGNLV